MCPPRAPKMVQCGSSGCTVCPKLHMESTLEGYTNRKLFGAIRSQAIDCRAKNLIYVISCQKCGQQYVGETSRTLATRMKEHMYNVKKGTAGTYLVDHFKQSNHSIQDMKFTVIEKLDDNATKQLREQKEDFWIRTLVSAFPFGMNDKIHGYGIISKGLNPINHNKHPYFNYRFPTRDKIRGTRKRSKKKIDMNKIIQCMSMLESQDKSIREKYVQLNRLSIKETVQLLHSMLNSSTDFSNIDELLVQAIMATKIKVKKQQPPNSASKIFLPVKFPNKGMDHLKLHTVFKDRRFVQKLGLKEKDIEITVAYQYNLPTGSRIFNHNKMLRKLNIAEMSKALMTPCDCATSPFIYPPIGHIITGDIHITKNSALQEILKLGAKHRIPAKIDWQLVTEATEDALQLLIIKLSKKLKKQTNANLITEAVELARAIIEKRIMVCKQQTTYDSTALTFGRLERMEIQSLHNKFVIAPADKAANNYIFICKKYYLLTMCNELGVSKNSATDCWEANGNAVYSPLHHTENQLISEHELQSSNFGVDVTAENKTLPIIYGIPKLHKNPYKFRFIAGACKSSVKPVSLVLTRILKQLKTWFHRYCNSCNFNGYWSIDSSLEALQKIKWKKCCRNITTADFSTLYTSLPHHLIFEQISKLIYILIKQKYFCIGYSTCFCSDNPPTTTKFFLKEEILEMVKFVLDNTCVKFAGFNFRQVSGIPMGGNASPLLADLTLSMLEFNYMKNASPLLRTSMGLCMRYIDDVLNINGRKFLDICKEIYPGCLPLEETTNSSYNANFLDISIHINNGKIESTLYNKVEAFNFDVIRMPHSSSGISRNIGVNVFYSQLIRIGRICSNSTEFCRKTKLLIETFIEKGYDPELLLHKCRLFVANYKPIILSLQLTSRQLLQLFMDYLF